MSSNYSLYDLVFSNITTPFNLLENYKLSNYDYVKYYMRETYSICEMKCIMDFKETIFYYYFDSSNFLQQIHMEQDGITQKMFDRKEEMQLLLKDKEAVQ